MGNGGRNSNGGRATVASHGTQKANGGRCTVASHGPQMGNGGRATKGKKKKRSGKKNKPRRCSACVKAGRDPECYPCKGRGRPKCPHLC